ncbi:hypothetical protein ACVRY6_07865 [Streptococcus ictaluri]|uniref:Hydrolase, alpha/beta domain protein n=1 Tax=Streptococcus ictaluri 707-05 TaxID=764299 RepID=G5K2K1_9STRE|nr:hypothetical protein STRIC_1013 [Streptococcus ictaluri 707-05]
MALYLASVCGQIKKLVLLDGGFLKEEDLPPKEKELKEAKTYMASKYYPNLDQFLSTEFQNLDLDWSDKEKAIVTSFRNEDGKGFYLNLHHEQVLWLLSLRRQALGLFESTDLTCDTLMLISQDISKLFSQSIKSIQETQSLQIIEGTSHLLYLEKPKLLAQKMADFLIE